MRAAGLGPDLLHHVLHGRAAGTRAGALEHGPDRTVGVDQDGRPGPGRGASGHHPQHGLSRAPRHRPDEGAGRERAMGDPADFGSVAAFLCSAQAGFVNGAAWWSTAERPWRCSRPAVLVRGRTVRSAVPEVAGASGGRLAGTCGPRRRSWSRTGDADRGSVRVGAPVRLATLGDRCHASAPPVGTGRAPSLDGGDRLRAAANGRRHLLRPGSVTATTCPSGCGVLRRDGAVGRSPGARTGPMRRGGAA